MRKLKNSGTPFAALTAYDYSSAKLVDEAGIPIILVGDSAAMVVLGHQTTLPVTMGEMIMLASAVTRGVTSALVVGDMPFMSYQASVEDAVRSAGRFIQKAHVGAVKLEGGSFVRPQISAIVKCGIPVMGHVGLTPQSVHQMSGYRIQGKSVSDAAAILEDALAVEEAGAFSIVLEGIPAELARTITETLKIPTIGIGAGPFCDGQIQVFHDILGLADRVPRHAKTFADAGRVISDGLLKYRKDVETGAFPEEKNLSHLNAVVQDSLRKT